MSTNFYLKVEPAVTVLGDVVTFDDMDPNIHVGLRTSTVFKWAQEPERLKAYGEAHPDEKFIANEYGDEFTWDGFLAQIDGLQERREMIGQRFC